MRRVDRNDLLTGTSPGTAMGELFRRYWIPVLLTEELPGPDCPPVRVGVLSERLIAFRDSNDRLGLIDEFCAHRRVSLWFGRNEENGLRCSYHGWKYDVSGQCVDLPSEPDRAGIRQRVKLKSYPLIEQGGVLWTYMGPPAHRPAPPRYEFSTVGLARTYTSKRLQYCNWLQALEGGIDSSHVSWLHRDALRSDPLMQASRGNAYNMRDMMPVFETAAHPGGLFIGARRDAGDGKSYWRITPFCLPSFTMIPPRGDHPVHGHFWVPIDDETCWAWSYDYHPTRDLTDGERAAMRAGKGIHVATIPGGYVPVANRDNDYLMDRAAQREGRSYSGVAGIGMQDASLQESMGPIVDRSKEILVSTDNGIVMARRLLIEAAQALKAHGTPPPGVDPDTHLVRSASVVLRDGEVFAVAACEALTVRPGVPPVTV